jgi:hypothetical protein
MRVEGEKFKAARGFDSEHDFVALLDLKWGIRASTSFFGGGAIKGDITSCNFLSTFLRTIYITTTNRQCGVSRLGNWFINYNDSIGLAGILTVKNSLKLPFPERKGIWLVNFCEKE